MIDQPLTHFVDGRMVTADEYSAWQRQQTVEWDAAPAPTVGDDPGGVTYPDGTGVSLRAAARYDRLRAAADGSP